MIRGNNCKHRKQSQKMVNVITIEMSCGEAQYAIMHCEDCNATYRGEMLEYILDT